LTSEGGGLSLCVGPFGFATEKLMRYLDKHLWVVLLAVAVVVTVACSSNSTPSGDDGGKGSGSEAAADALTKS